MFATNSLCYTLLLLLISLSYHNNCSIKFHYTNIYIYIYLYIYIYITRKLLYEYLFYSTLRMTVDSEQQGVNILKVLQYTIIVIGVL